MRGVQLNGIGADNMAKQLDIFDVEPEIVSLDLKRANIRKSYRGAVYTDLLIKVPKDARTDKDYETWDHICYALWKKLKCAWEEVVEQVERHRIDKTSLAVRVPIKHGQAVHLPAHVHVVQYL